MSTLNYKKIYDAIQVVKSNYPDNPEIDSEINRIITGVRNKYGESPAFYLEHGRTPTSDEMLERVKRSDGTQPAYQPQNPLMNMAVNSAMQT